MSKMINLDVRMERELRGEHMIDKPQSAVCKFKMDGAVNIDCIRLGCA